MANTIIAVDSMTKLPDAIVGRVLVSGSHGGLYPAYLAAKRQVRGVGLFSPVEVRPMVPSVLPPEL